MQPVIYDPTFQNLLVQASHSYTGNFHFFDVLIICAFSKLLCVVTSYLARL